LSVDPPPLSRSALAIPSSVFADLAPRIELRRQAGADLVELHLGDTHRAPPSAARFGEVEEGAFDADLYRYGNVLGLAALREAFVEHLTRTARAMPGADPARHVLVGCGATHALFCALRAVVDADDEVLVAAPYWPLAVGVVRASGAVPVEVPLTGRLGADPSLDLAAVLRGSLTGRTRAVYFATPNNPDGKVWSPAQLARLASFATQHGLWVFADEVYADYVYDGAHASIARLDGMAERTVSIYSVSKSHALPGARVGFAVAPERVVTVARRVGTHSVFNVPVAAQRLALAALRGAGDWIAEAWRDYREARDALVRGLDGSGLRLEVPEGGSFAFVDLAPVLRGRTPTEVLESAVDHGVLVAPGEGFGDGFGSWSRLCFTCVTQPRLVEGVRRLREAFGEFRSDLQS
jgi:aspartate/methionine/tyrosine aminotransferase